MLTARRACLLVTCLLPLASAPAGAQPASAGSPATSAPATARSPAGDRVVARRHFERGERAYAVGRFRVAIDHYRAAYEALPLPQFLFNLAQCHRNLKEYEQAVFFYRKYLERHPQAEDREKIVYTIGQLERLRASSEQHERQTRLLSPAPARREEPRSSRRALWITGGVVAAVGAGALTFFLWPRAPSGDLGRIDLSLRGGR